MMSFELGQHIIEKYSQKRKLVKCDYTVRITFVEWYVRGKILE